MEIDFVPIKPYTTESVLIGIGKEQPVDFNERKLTSIPRSKVPCDCRSFTP